MKNTTEQQTLDFSYDELPLFKEEVDFTDSQKEQLEINYCKRQIKFHLDNNMQFDFDAHHFLANQSENPNAMKRVNMMKEIWDIELVKYLEEKKIQNKFKQFLKNLLPY